MKYANSKSSYAFLNQALSCLGRFLQRYVFRALLPPKTHRQDKKFIVSARDQFEQKDNVICIDVAGAGDCVAKNIVVAWKVLGLVNFSNRADHEHPALGSNPIAFVRCVRIQKRLEKQVSQDVQGLPAREG